MKFSRKLLGAALLTSLLVACDDADNTAQAAGTTPGIVVRNDGSADPRLATAAAKGMQRAAIMDNNGFERPLPATTSRFRRAGKPVAPSNRISSLAAMPP